MGVFLAYASLRGYTLLDRRLSIPQEWFSPEYAALRQRGGIPEDLPFRTHQELAGEMVEGLHRRGVVPFRWVLGDEEFGRDTHLLDRMAGLGVWYFMEVPVDTRAWRERPQIEIPEWKGRGCPPVRQRPRADAPAAQTVAAIAAQLPPVSGSAIPCMRGAKGLWLPISPACGW